MSDGRWRSRFCFILISRPEVGRGEDGRGWLFIAKFNSDLGLSIGAIQSIKRNLMQIKLNMIGICLTSDPSAVQYITSLSVIVFVLGRPRGQK